MAKRTPKPCKACGLIECECFARLSEAIMNTPILVTDDRVICSLHCALGIQREGVSGPRLPAENDEKEV